MATVDAYYYTDPACPWSWALEPSRRCLERDFGDALRWKYVMCGMAREFGGALELIGEALEAADRSGMPVDTRLWLQAAPRSSYPACIAIKAAAEQEDPGRYLRRLREGLLCRRRKLDGMEALIEEARVIGGLDLDKLRVALASHAILEAFGADLERAAAVPERFHASGTGRVRLPSIEFVGADGDVHGVYGYVPEYTPLREAAIAAGASPPQAVIPSVEEALRRFESLASAEVAALCALPGPRAPAELWRLASEWRVQAERAGTGELWRLA